MSHPKLAVSAAELSAALRAAMRRMPGAVTLVTTRDPQGDNPTAVIPVSMDPPSMLIAINTSASAHGSIERAGRYCINLLGTTQTALVGLFSNSALRDKRFQSDDWSDLNGMPYLPGACSSIFCNVDRAVLCGTHRLFIGAVYDVRATVTDSSCPLGWMEGDFAQLWRLETI